MRPHVWSRVRRIEAAESSCDNGRGDQSACHMIGECFATLQVKPRPTPRRRSRDSLVLLRSRHDTASLRGVSPPHTWPVALLRLLVPLAPRARTASPLQPSPTDATHKHACTSVAARCAAAPPRRTTRAPRSTTRGTATRRAVGRWWRAARRRAGRGGTARRASTSARCGSEGLACRPRIRPRARASSSTRATRATCRSRIWRERRRDGAIGGAARGRRAETVAGEASPRAMSCATRGDERES
jgi:hypothetical protein